MFITNVLLLSRAWGMSCYDVKHYTKQPTQPLHNLLFLSIIAFFSAVRIRNTWLIPKEELCYIAIAPGVIRRKQKIECENMYIILQWDNIYGYVFNQPLILSLCLLSPSFTDDETKLCLPQCRYLTLQRHGKCPFFFLLLLTAWIKYQSELSLFFSQTHL